MCARVREKYAKEKLHLAPRLFGHSGLGVVSHLQAAFTRLYQRVDAAAARRSANLVRKYIRRAQAHNVLR